MSQNAALDVLTVCGFWRLNSVLVVVEALCNIIQHYITIDEFIIADKIHFEWDQQQLFIQGFDAGNVCAKHLFYPCLEFSTVELQWIRKFKE